MSAPTATTLREDVKNGIAYLEEEYGSEFHKQIDLDRLNIANSRLCVMGQLEGNFNEWFDRHCELDPLRLGFATRVDKYGQLTRIWKEELLARSA